MAAIKQIKTDSFTEEIINKSKFLAFSFCVQTKNDVEIALNVLKTKYSDCTHICYAYKLATGEEKCFDDGEPQGTAGLPILDVIKKNDVCNVLIAVVRYFGGVKLGAGGLLRAYSNSASNVLKLSNVTQAEKCKKITFELPVSMSKYVKIFENLMGIKKQEVKFADKITISIFVILQQVDSIKQQINDILALKIDFIEDDNIFFVGE